MDSRTVACLAWNLSRVLQQSCDDAPLCEIAACSHTSDDPRCIPCQCLASEFTGKKKLEWSPTSLAMLTLPSLAFLLGCWQIARMKQKRELIAHIHARLSLPAVAFPSNNVEMLDEMEYEKVTLNGRFDHSREFLIYPRARFDEPIETRGRNKEQSNYGAHVITPLHVANCGLTVLVNRGWVPQEKMDPNTRSHAQIPGNVTFDAIVRHTEKRPAFSSRNNPSRGQWFYKDVDEMADYYDTDAIFVDAVKESTIPGGPIGGQTKINIRDEHLSYICTWYSLAVLTFGLWIARFYK